jgi:signal transduction histidine kinase
VGGILAVTGVCAVDVGSWEALVTHREPQGFTLLARGVEDVQVERAAPWWTVTRLAWVLAALGLGLLGLLGAVWARARRRLREAARTREAARAQFSAILGERTRLAREIHDTLAQGFAGVSMQLEVLNDRLAHAAEPDTLRHLNVARELVRTSLVESRRTVWNLRSQALEEHGLAASLARMGEQLAGSGHIQWNFQIEGRERPLPPEIENNLLRIGQEALTNAARHANAGTMSLTLAFPEDAVRLTVHDDGRGFDASVSAPTREGGFGLAGIRERAAEMGAALRLESTPGLGTTIEITIFHV